MQRNYHTQVPVTSTDGSGRLLKISGTGAKRTMSMRSTMNTVGHWMQSVDFSKHRSLSLPSVAKRSGEAQEKQRAENRRLSFRKKMGLNKSFLGSTSTIMTGMLQKVRRKSSTQSSSDESDSESYGFRKNKPSAVTYTEADINELFPTVGKAEKPLGSCLEVDALELFQTVGNKKSLREESEQSSNSKEPSPTSVQSDGSQERPASGNFPVITGGPQEFAVSRALEEFRKEKQAVSETKNVVEINAPSPDGATVTESTPKSVPVSPVSPIRQAVMSRMLSVDSASVIRNDRRRNLSPQRTISEDENQVFVFGSNRLELPSQKQVSFEEDDSRSLYSYRSSRVSSRRQSTEESIDTDDEWYRYELRKLELMEEAQKYEDEVSGIQPNDGVKIKMGRVFEELLSHVRPFPSQDSLKAATKRLNREMTFDQEAPDASHDVHSHEISWMNSNTEKIEHSAASNSKSPESAFFSGPSDSRHSSLRVSESQETSVDENNRDPAAGFFIYGMETSSHVDTLQQKEPRDPRTEIKYEATVVSGPQPAPEVVQISSPVEDEDAKERGYSSGDTSGPDENPPSLGEDDEENQLEYPPQKEGVVQEISEASNDHPEVTVTGPEQEREQTPECLPPELSPQDSFENSTSPSGMPLMGKNKWKLLKTLKEKKEDAMKSVDLPVVGTPVSKKKSDSLTRCWRNGNI
jgi:hypothetical protein